MTNRFPSAGLVAAFMAVGFLGPAAWAVEPAEEAVPVPATVGAGLPAEPEAPEPEAARRKREREAELEAIRRSIEVSQQRQNTLRTDIAGLESDRARMSADLIATAQRLRATEAAIAEIETRLDQLHANEDGIRASLRNRRAVLAEILMALQRMGKTPPPALLSRPEDALAAIRGSILAGAVLPEIRVEAEALAADLAELTVLGARIEAERTGLRSQYASLGDDRARIDLLIERKKAQRAQTEVELSAEQRRATQLADQAQNLEGLIGSLERDLAAAEKAAADARKAQLAAVPAGKDDAARRLADTSRIAPALRFEDAKGLLTWPVPGTRTVNFGDPDGLGGKAQGLTLSTRPGTPVVSPADGWVVYAGPFRSYGQLLILNAGDGYHIVMAGMERIDAAVGQFVLAGEPIAQMGATRVASLGEVDHTSAQPTLYVEFRKESTAINSLPWWAPENTDEVKG